MADDKYEGYEQQNREDNMPAGSVGGTSGGRSGQSPG